MTREASSIRLSPGFSPLHEVCLRLRINRLPSEIIKAHRRGWSLRSGAVALSIFKTGTVALRGGSQAEQAAIRAALTPRDWREHESESRDASAAEPATAALAADDYDPDAAPW